MTTRDYTRALGGRWATAMQSLTTKARRTRSYTKKSKGGFDVKGTKYADLERANCQNTILHMNLMHFFVF